MTTSVIVGALGSSGPGQIKLKISVFPCFGSKNSCSQMSPKAKSQLI